jgi:hypothetical protein
MGPQRFVAELAGLVDGVLWDTRVWMAHRGRWPPKGERYASDLGWVDKIQDPALRDLTAAASQAPVPFLLGGHGVVSGGLYALLEASEPGG